MVRERSFGSNRRIGGLVALAVALGACSGTPAASGVPTMTPVAAGPTGAPSVVAATTAPATPVICDGTSTAVAPAESSAVAQGSVVGTVTIGTDAYDVAVADGSVWVASALDGYVKRIDPATRKVIATIELGTKSEDSYLLADGRRMWFTQWGKDSASTVGWIDMDANAVGGSIAVDPVPLGLAIDRDALWVTGFESQTVSELDAASGTVLRSIVVDPDRIAPPDVGPTDLAAVDGSLWIVGHRSSELVKVDAASGKVVARVCLPMPRPERIEHAFGSLWISDPGRVIVRADASTGAIVAVIPLPDYGVPAVRQPWGMAAGPDRLWVAAGTVAYWVDPATNTIPGFVQLTDEQGALDAAAVYPGAGIQNLAVDGSDLFAGFPGIGQLIHARA